MPTQIVWIICLKSSATVAAVSGLLRCCEEVHSTSSPHSVVKRANLSEAFHFCFLFSEPVLAFSALCRDNEDALPEGVFSEAGNSFLRKIRLLNSTAKPF